MIIFCFLFKICEFILKVVHNAYVCAVCTGCLCFSRKVGIKLAYREKKNQQFPYTFTLSTISVGMVSNIKINVTVKYVTSQKMILIEATVRPSKTHLWSRSGCFWQNRLHNISFQFWGCFSRIHNMLACVKDMASYKWIMRENVLFLCLAQMLIKERAL